MNSTRPAGRIRGLAAKTAVATIALTIALGAATATHARPTSSAYPPVRPTRVLVLGDSVMKGAANQYAAALPGRDVVVSAEVNRSTGQGADELARLGSDWDVVVILLGHNDGGSPGAYQPAVRRILDQLHAVPVVSWLTIHEVRPYYPAVNHFIAGLQAEYPNLVVGDWNARAVANPGAVAGDGLHLTGAGASLMADLVAEQVHIGEFRWAQALEYLRRANTTTTTEPPTTTTTTTEPTTTQATTTIPPTTAPPAPTTTPTPASAGEAAAVDQPATGTPMATYAIAALGLAGAATVGVVRRRRSARSVKVP